VCDFAGLESSLVSPGAGSGFASAAVVFDVDRPRERLFAHGGERASPGELIALILGSGIRGLPATELARAVLDQAGGLLALSRASPRELTRIAGIGPARAARLAAAFHLGRRALATSGDRLPRLLGPEDVFERLRPRMAGLVQEVFVVIALDARNGVIDEIEVARGCLTGVEVHPREVFRPLIRLAAAAGVVAHNHPSGSNEPSAEDRALTRRLQDIGELIGIPILDHVVIGHAGFGSA
jgi:DNA repair protein RadC